jgi:hypothetical protein
MGAHYRCIMIIVSCLHYRYTTPLRGDPDKCRSYIEIDRELSPFVIINLALYISSATSNAALPSPPPHPHQRRSPNQPSIPSPS